jgi:hypothetical protein
VGSLPPRTNFGTFLRAAAEGTVFRVQVDSQLTEPLTLRYEGDDAETVTDMQVATQAAAVINKAANEARALHSRSSER